MDIKYSAVNALFRLLRPLVRIMMNYGVGVDEFIELAKRAYVDVAEREFTLEGRKQSTSRIAVLTGMHRKEVARLRQPDELEVMPETSRLSRVISGWCNDQRFLNEQKKPALLNIEQFAELVASYSGNMTSRATLDELLRVEAVTWRGRALQLTRKVYIPHKSDLERLAMMGEASSDLLNTLSVNLSQPEENRLQLSTVFDNLPAEVIPQLKTLCHQRSSELLAEIESFLISRDRDSNPGIEGSGRMRAGLGIYYIEESMEPDLFQELA
ncbi:DUF6502 family protein [Oceanicoccus sp. KOV_DT_Chl]|uniref:DUF6502 family protein n=1 Tax=Oceanicoccus sp. KOV_DT_Chl TaxID=1904639 RepID=UPI002101614C|nr:DUF6502 family protein [Oceanicoccus sp. KOV_DT_Chl]